MRGQMIRLNIERGAMRKVAVIIQTIKSTNITAHAEFACAMNGFMISKLSIIILGLGPMA